MRAVLLALLALAMLAVSILTWGSLGSVVMVLGLIVMAAALAYQHFLTNRDSDRFQEE